ncbi:MAG: TrbI/VirB10 family protein [Hyphomonadaceae bacterium]
MSEDQDTPAPAQPLGETESPDLRLRAKPPRVVRLSRRALAIMGVAAGAALGGVVIYALQPPPPQTERELHVAEGRARSDVLANAPQDYSQAPPLGPPLPGDLGRPILDAQARGESVPVPPIGAGAAGADADRGVQEQDAARTSQLFLAASSARRSEPAGSGQTLSLLQAPAALADGAAQGSRADFLNREPDRRTVSAERIQPPASPYLIQAGSVIPAALITGIRSDLPGQITALVTEHVYDSPTRRFLLIPQGSRLIGTYESEVSFGQERVLLGWDRLIFPGGESIVLERQPGADAAGFAGLQDRVDHHWGNVARAAFVSTLLGIGAEVGRDDDDIARAIRRGAQDTINQAGQQMVQRELGIRPTLTIRPGHPLRVIVTRDLVLSPRAAP